jgi:outer membrane cobalamin receptor
MNLRTIRRASLAVALLPLLVPLHVPAQTPTKLEPVVVTAARDAQPITDVLADITVMVLT